MNMTPHLAFMSCEVQDEARLERAFNTLGYTYTVGQGCYKGVLEKSYRIILSTDPRVVVQRLDVVYALAEALKQNCILYVDPEKTAYLLYCHSPRAPRIGKLIQTAIPFGDYSYFDGKYYEVE